MPIIKEVNGLSPKIDASAFVAENATITGNVVIGAHSSIWFQTVIRGDVNLISIGDNVNIQDLTMVHGTKGRGDTIVEDNVSIGHRAIIHGCVIRKNVLIGMGAIILDDIEIPSEVIIAAGALVTSNQKLESGYIYAGSPVRKLKPISKEAMEHYVHGTSKAYVEYQEYYKD